MGGESSTSSSGSESSNGNDIELVSLKSARLFLVDQEESFAMQRGDFKLVLTKQLHSPLAAVVAIVKDVEWPVGKDCSVIKLGRGCYTFCLPGFSYGLVLDGSTATADASSSPCDLSTALEQLELFLGKYCTYEDRSGDVGARFLPDRDDESRARDFWNRIGGNPASLNETSSAKAAPFNVKQPKQQQEQQQEERKEAGKVSSSSPSPRMMKRVQQARRLSAIAKLLSRALLKGAISNVKHVTAKESSEETVASVDAFAKVVDAVETMSKPPGSNKLTTDHGQQQQQDQQQQQQNTKPQLIETSWTLNRFGLELLIGAVAASTALNLSSSMRPSTTSYPAQPQQPQQQQRQASQQRPPLPVSSTTSPFPHRPLPPQQSHHQA